MANGKENDPISVSLKSQLVNRKYSQSKEENDGDEFSLDNSLISSVRRILESKVEFEKVPGYSLAVQASLKGKYKILAPPKKVPVNSELERSTSGLGTEKSNDFGVSPKKSSVDSAVRDSLCPPVPSVTLYPESAVKLGWEGNEPIGAGMINLGNTCYLNSTLQALFHVPSFCNWLSRETVHNGTGKCDQAFVSGEMCIICAMAATLRVARAQTGGVIKPVHIYGRLRSICKHLSHGHQEDAHEFLRFLIEGMERTFLLRFKGKKLDNLSKETTPLHRIFGGYLRNEVTCHSCGRVSTTFQLFQDLFLDIRQSSTLLESMQAFFSREKLEGDESRSDSYKCEKCKSKGNCTKRVYVQIPPKVLCIQLKRFTAMGKKIMKHISYPLKLDLSPYIYLKMIGKSDGSISPQQKIRHPVPYKLVSIVSHYGSALNCGHYTAVGKTAKGSYCIFDDSQVRAVSLNSALGASAYILMYEMEPGWNIGLENKGIHNIEKLNNGSLKPMNSNVKSLVSTSISQKSQITTLVKPEVKSISSPKLNMPSLHSDNSKVANTPVVLKSFNSSFLSNVESNFRKSSFPRQENFISLSKTPEGQHKSTLNGWINRGTSTTAAHPAQTVSLHQKEPKISFTSSVHIDHVKQPPSVVQKQLLLPKLLDLKTPNGAHTSTSKAKNNEQNHSKLSKSCKPTMETNCVEESISMKQLTPPVTSSNFYQFDQNLAQNLQSLKRSLTPVMNSEGNKQTNSLSKKQLTLPNLLSAKNNQSLDGGNSVKTPSQNKIRTLKDWLEDKNPITGINAGNEMKQLHQDFSTRSCSVKQTVVSTVGGWKVTEHDLSNDNTDGTVQMGLKRKQEMRYMEHESKKKRYDKVANAEVWRKFSRDKIPFLHCSGIKKKSSSVNGKDRHKEKINGAAASYLFMNLAKKKFLF